MARLINSLQKNPHPAFQKRLEFRLSTEMYNTVQTHVAKKKIEIKNYSISKYIKELINNDINRESSII